ncbi:beta-fructofuranosidase 5 [Striga asiatica]|uniref:Beta-fructofuranosidase 5 n=1 Tax=Striga asiatica TaxID=4170 RepID=A0A5A7QQH2_STRAF|nr:beta-fructofuranosidase 5 [Striga asiatica]
MKFSFSISLLKSKILRSPTSQQSQRRSSTAASLQTRQILAAFPEAFNQNLPSDLSRIWSPLCTAAPHCRCCPSFDAESPDKTLTSKSTIWLLLTTPRRNFQLVSPH